MDDAGAQERCNAAHLFELVWETIADVIGTAATATLMRRSVKRASDRGHALSTLTITREGFDYRYSIPADWQRDESGSVVALRELARELSPLLIELTGPVLIRRLGAVVDLQRCQILFLERPQ